MLAKPAISGWLGGGGDEGGEPLRIGGGIGIEQRNKLAVVEHRDADVVGGGEADVLVQPDQRHAWIRSP